MLDKDQISSGDLSLKKLFVPFTTNKAIHWIIVIGFLVYGNMLFNDFVWDDIVQIVQASKTRSIADIPDLFIGSQQTLFYRPVFHSFLTFIFSIFGTNVFIFHSLQLAIHIINSILLFFLFRNFIQAKLSFFLVLIFLIHPINAEAVSYISAVSDPLFSLFGLLAFHIMIRNKLSWLRLVTGCILMLFSVLTKEAGFLFLLLIALHRIIYLKAEYIKTALFVLVPSFIYFYLRFAVSRTFFTNVEQFASIGSLTLTERLITMPKIIFFYINTFIAPIRLSIAQQWVVKTPTFYDFYLPLIVIILFLGILFTLGWNIWNYHRKKFKNFTFFLIWFFITIGLYLQIFPLDMTVAERWFYMPMMGLLGIIGVGIHSRMLSNNHLKTYFIYGFIIIFIIFAFRTIIRNTNWYTPYALYSHDILISPDSFDLHNKFSIELIRLKQYDKALKHAQKAISLNPLSPPSHTTAGILYMLKNDYKTGVSHFKKALYLKEGYYISHINLIYGQLCLGDYVAARNQANLSLKLFPDDPEIVLYLAMAEYQAGNNSQATALAKKAYEILPDARRNQMYSLIKNNKPINFKPQVTY